MKHNVDLNEPVVDLIKLVESQGEGWRKASKSLQTRFHMLDWPIQIQILNIHLDLNTKQARHWVYSQMLSYYDKSLKNIIRTHRDAAAKALKSRLLTESLQHLNEFQPAYFAVLYAPIKEVRKNEKRLGRTLFFCYDQLAMRLATDPNWQPKKERCANLSYYSVMANHHRQVSLNEAREDFLNYFFASETCFDQSAKPQSINFKFGISLLYSKDVLGFIKDIESMGHKQLADGIRLWDASLQKRLMAIHDADTIMRPYPNWAQLDYYKPIFFTMAVNDIETSRYPEHSLNRMIAGKEALMKITHELDLKVVDTLPF